MFSLAWFVIYRDLEEVLNAKDSELQGMGELQSEYAVFLLPAYPGTDARGRLMQLREDIVKKERCIATLESSRAEYYHFPSSCQGRTQAAS